MGGIPPGGEERHAISIALTRQRGRGYAVGHRTIEEILLAARTGIDRVEPEDLADELLAGALVVDIRPREQRELDGELPGAVIIDRNVLEWRLDPASPHRIPATGYDRRVVLVCREGYSSSLAAASLRDLGLVRATDLVGGYLRWATVIGRAVVEGDGTTPKAR